MMNIWGMTDIGLVRRENQDAYAVQVSEDTGFTVCVVCDGMGGARAGNVASTMAVEHGRARRREAGQPSGGGHLPDHLHGQPPEGYDLGAGPGGDGLCRGLRQHRRL